MGCTASSNTGEQQSAESPLDAISLAYTNTVSSLSLNGQDAGQPRDLAHAEVSVCPDKPGLKELVAQEDADLAREQQDVQAYGVSLASIAYGLQVNMPAGGGNHPDNVLEGIITDGCLVQNGYYSGENSANTTTLPPTPTQRSNFNAFMDNAYASVRGNMHNVLAALQPIFTLEMDRCPQPLPATSADLLTWAMRQVSDPALSFDG